MVLPTAMHESEALLDPQSSPTAATYQEYVTWNRASSPGDAACLEPLSSIVVKKILYM